MSLTISCGYNRDIKDIQPTNAIEHGLNEFTKNALMLFENA